MKRKFFEQKKAYDFYQEYLSWYETLQFAGVLKGHILDHVEIEFFEVEPCYVVTVSAELLRLINQSIRELQHAAVSY
jgi:hypothetical protein